MSGLPRTLAPWAALLAPLSEDLQLGLGEWVRRIAAAVGDRERAQAQAGEPDGFSGISRRGPYDRLLLTEWLLARELPEEFTRRAIMGEHLFLDRARRSLGAPQGLTALVDAGPDQLGTPRIAQLAVLIVLAAHAEAAMAGFTWGVLQDPGDGLHRGFGEHEVRRFLSRRTRVPATAEAAEAWAKVDGLGEADLWLVGGERFLDVVALPAARILVEDVERPDERAVRLEVRRRGGGTRELVLPLPPTPDCTRLLRDPFRAAAAPGARPGGARPDHVLDPRGGVLFAPFGQRAAVRLAGARVLDLHVPGSTGERAGSARPRRIPDGLVAFGWAGSAGKHLVAHVRPGTEGKVTLAVRTPWAERWHSSPPELAAVSDPDGPLRPCLLWPRSRSARIWVLDARGTLRALGNGEGEIVATGVAAISAAQELAFVAGEGGLAWVELRRVGETRRHPVGPFTGRAFIGCRGPEEGSAAAGAVESQPGGLWTIFLARWGGVSAPLQVRPFPGSEVTGVAAYPHPGALVILEDDRRTFTALGRGGPKKVHEAETSVAAAAVDPTGHRLGYITERGDVVFLSLFGGGVLLHRSFEVAR